MESTTIDLTEYERTDKVTHSSLKNVTYYSCIIAICIVMTIAFAYPVFLYEEMWKKIVGSLLPISWIILGSVTSKHYITECISAEEFVALGALEKATDGGSLLEKLVQVGVDIKIHLSCFENVESRRMVPTFDKFNENKVAYYEEILINTLKLAAVKTKKYVIENEEDNTKPLELNREKMFILVPVNINIVVDPQVTKDVQEQMVAFYDEHKSNYYECYHHVVTKVDISELVETANIGDYFIHKNGNAETPKILTPFWYKFFSLLLMNAPYRLLVRKYVGVQRLVIEKFVAK